LPNPAFTFPAPGNYTISLITNKNDKCSDTATAIAKIYPGFVPAFTVVDACNGVPYTFKDNSTSAFGQVDKWKWDFGNANATNDTANTSNAAYTFTQNGNYTVSLIVGNSLGCSDTIVQQISVGDKPSLIVPNDTVICSIDTLRLTAIGSGVFSWSPNYMISNTGVSNPLVSPDVPTRYTVTLRQASGCENTASVLVDVKLYVSLKAGNDTTICLGDSIPLRPVSDAVTYSWSPAPMVSNPTAKFTWAKPTGTTRISALANIGLCQANDGFLVTTVPYPLASAGADTSICFGDKVRLSARGGSKYLWYPGNTLDDQTAQFPIATPYATTDYAVEVYENKGCPKPTYDTVRVTVIPQVKAFAGRDTVAVIGQPLQLLATGGANYNWSPASFLSNPTIPNPIAKLNDDIRYIVRVSSREGCYAFDTVNVKIYKTPPEIFVPTAFTPNDDNLNDRLIPIPVGIAQLVYFKVYNRYGEMVFSTEEIGKGWNGVYKGRDQGNESFVWHALGIDYLGNPVFRKGQSTLIR
jgi:gliding motility-associated-like protein